MEENKWVFSEKYDPNTWDTKPNPMFEAFSKKESALDFRVDWMRFNEFQRGWNEALSWVNSQIEPKPDSMETK